MKAATRPFKSKYLSWCPLCQDRIRSGDLIVKVEVPIRWHQVRNHKYKVRQYVQQLFLEYVHKACFDKRNKELIPLEEH